MSHENNTPPGERKIDVAGREVIVYRTLDGVDWLSTNQAEAYLQASRYMTIKVIGEWEESGKIKRKKIKGPGLYISRSDLDLIKAAIHSAHD